MMAATVTGYTRFSGENALKSAVANKGPVRGVFYDEQCPKNFNHAVSRMNENIFFFVF
jgi:hypothetical protein